MKTIAFNRAPRSIFFYALVLGGLGALYYYRRQGGRLMPLVSGAVGLVSSVRNSIGATLGDSALASHSTEAESSDSSSSYASSGSGSTSTGRPATRRSKARRNGDIATSPENLDSYPSV